MSRTRLVTSRVSSLSSDASAIPSAPLLLTGRAVPRGPAAAATWLLPRARPSRARGTTAGRNPGAPGRSWHPRAGGGQLIDGRRVIVGEAGVVQLLLGGQRRGRRAGAGAGAGRRV